MTTVKWYGDEVMGDIEHKLLQRLKRAAGEWRRTAVKRMGRANGDGRNPSAPGEFPKRVTGNLRRNINQVVIRRNMVAQVGTNVKYGRHLQQGAPKIRLDARPWVTLTNNLTRSKILRIMKRPL